jgi:hypothetical protein
LPRIVRFPWPKSLRFCRAWSLASNGSCWSILLLNGRRAVRALALPRTARHALEPAHAARHLAVSLQQAAPAVTRAPHACRPPCRAPPFYLPPAPRRTEPVTAELPWRPRLPARLQYSPLPLPAMHRMATSERESTRIQKPKPTEIETEIKPKSYGPRARPSLRARARL